MAFDSLVFSLQMRALLTAGLPLGDALASLSERQSASDAEARILSSTRQSLAQGLPFSVALAQATHSDGGKRQAAPAILIALLRAAEQTGQVAQALERYADYESRLRGARRQIVSAMLYPVTLTVIGSAVVVFLLVYVVPKFAKIYETISTDLPWASMLLVRWGELVNTHGGRLAAVAVMVVMTLWLIWTTPAWREAMLEVVWRWKVLGASRAEFELARYYRTVGTLLHAGLPILEAHALAGPTLGPRYHAALGTVEQALQQGLPLSTGLHEAGMLTPLAGRLIRSGEGVGSVGAMLLQTATFHEEDTWRKLERFSKVFEPAAMAVLGTTIGIIVILMYMPIFDLAQALQ